MSDKKILSLWGMPGAGKTHWGKKLSEELSIRFIDLDAFIEEEAKIAISEMVIKKGESYFRNKENEALKKILRTDKEAILSLGGGTPCFDINRILLEQNSFNIWLNVDIPSIIENLKQQTESRPLIDPKSDLRVQMEMLLEERKEHYKRADLIIEQPLRINKFLNLIPDDFKKTSHL